MPYATPSIRLDWLFSLRNAPDELAETGCHLSSASLTAAQAIQAAQALQQDAQLLVDDMVGLLTTSSALAWASYSGITGVRMAAVGTDGKEISEPFELVGEPYYGTSTVVPPQLSVVLSLRTGSRLGYANRGRMFLPHTSMQLVTNSPYGSTAPAVAAAAGTFLGVVNTRANQRLAGLRISNLSSVGAGTTKPVSQVLVGNVIDTQRRRRNQLQESYTTVALP